MNDKQFSDFFGRFIFVILVIALLVGICGIAASTGNPEAQAIMRFIFGY